MKGKRKKRNILRVIAYVIVLILAGIFIERKLGDSAKFSVINQAVAPGPSTGAIDNTGATDIGD